MNKNILIIEDTNKILEFIESKSPSMARVVEECTNSKYILIHKYLTHSDLITSGKRTGPEQNVEKNYLYYLSSKEMNEIEKEQNKKFEAAKQSNISVPERFFAELGIHSIQRRIGKQIEQHVHPILNRYAKFYLVNDTLKYFNGYYTKKIFEKLNKNTDWNFDELNLNLVGDFTEIQVSQAVHGIGTKADEQFHILRKSMFRNDVIMFLFKIDSNGERNVYIMLEKNPRFFSILGESNAQWEQYLKKKLHKDKYELIKKDNAGVEDEKTRKQQNKWRNMLAEEMMNYTTADGEIFCPLTYITADFYATSPLFVASHIKAFSECNVQEAFDINNGILICANADALFDKHLITINENKEIVFSFLIDNNQKLKSQLLLTTPIFKTVFNDERMKYLEYHRNIFNEKESKRKIREIATIDGGFEFE